MEWSARDSTRAAGTHGLPCCRSAVPPALLSAPASCRRGVGWRPSAAAPPQQQVRLPPATPSCRWAARADAALRMLPAAGLPAVRWLRTRVPRPPARAAGLGQPLARLPLPRQCSSWILAAARRTAGLQAEAGAAPKQAQQAAVHLQGRPSCLHPQAAQAAPEGRAGAIGSDCTRGAGAGLQGQLAW